jgi:hypothetical protein
VLRISLMRLVQADLKAPTIVPSDRVIEALNRPIVGGTACRALSANPNNTRYMIRHDYESVQLHIRFQNRCAKPFVSNDIAPLVQVHFTVDHVTEQTFPTIRADGNKIGAGLRVVVFPQSD